MQRSIKHLFRATIRNLSMKWACGVATALAFGLAGPAQAAPVTYTIDQSASSISLSGSIEITVGALGVVPGTYPIVGQGDASALVDSYQGTITGDLVGGTLSFDSSGGSVIDADLNVNASSPFDPTTPAGEDNYGGAVSIGGVFGTINVAIRDMILDITAGSVTDGLAPAGMVFTGDAGVIANTIGSPSSLVGDTFANSSASAAGLTTAGGIETLSIPLLFSAANTPFSALGLEGTFSASLDGVLVATRVVPEPGSIVLAGLAAAAMFILQGGYKPGLSPPRK